MPMLCEHALTENGPFDKCLSCQYLGNGCSGPRTTAMTSDRYLMWMKELRKLRGVNNQTIADKTGLSKTTVDDFFAGRRKDIGRITAGMMEDFLIGNAAKWPCAMELAEDNKEIIYQDRPETLEALQQLKSVLQEKTENYNAKIEEYKKLALYLQSQIERKDDYIDRLAKKAGI